jgi:hypothetical protein
VTIALANRAAMRNLVPGRVVPRPLGPDLGAESVKGSGPVKGSDLGTGAVKGSDLGTGAVKGSDLGAAAVKGRAGDSNVAAGADEPNSNARRQPPISLLTIAIPLLLS